MTRGTTARVDGAAFAFGRPTGLRGGARLPVVTGVLRPAPFAVVRALLAGGGLSVSASLLALSGTRGREYERVLARLGPAADGAPGVQWWCVGGYGRDFSLGYSSHGDIPPRFVRVLSSGARFPSRSPRGKPVWLVGVVQWWCVGVCG